MTVKPTNHAQTVCFRAFLLRQPSVDNYFTDLLHLFFSAYPDTMSYWKILLAASVFGLPMTAQAQMSDLTCDDSTRLSQMLSEVMGAERRALGLREPETLLEVWIDPRTADWTLVQSYANGTSCIIAMGEHWEDLSPAPA